jgi:hypothetical protein
MSKNNKSTQLDVFCSEIESRIVKHFPKSFVKVFHKNMIGSESIYINFAVGNQSNWSNEIFENDPMATKAIIHNCENEKMVFKNVYGFNVTTKPEDKYHAYSSVKIKRTKKTGSKEQVLNHIDNLFSKLLQLVKDNRDNMVNDHNWVDKYISDNMK